MEMMILHRIRSAFTWLYYFCRFVNRQFIARRGLQSAASLAYTTLLSVVPLVGVMFSFFGNLPVFKDISEILQEFVFGNFVPAFGQTVREYLIGFSVKASQMTVTGITVLVLIALMMMSTIEGALNHIWNVPERRNPTVRFVIYWSILTLGPILIGAGLYSTSYLLALPAVHDVDASLMIKSRLLTIMPFITTSIAFSIMYILIPNCYVHQRSAVIGGITAALSFEAAKYAFGIYVRSVPAYETIYGAIAVIPMFLVWIYLSWVIVLLGAQIGYCLSVFQLENVQGRGEKQGWDFLDAYRVIAELWQAQKNGEQLNPIQLRKRGLRMPQTMLNEILELLWRVNWVHRTGSGAWMLIRDVNELTLLDLYQLLPGKFPMKIDNPSDKWQQTLAEIINLHHQDLEKEFAVPLGDLLRKAE